MRRAVLVTLVLCLSLVLWPLAADARLENDPGNKLMHDYVLTMPKVTAYDSAYRALLAAAAGDASLGADLHAASDELNPTIADTIEKMTRHPRLYAFFQKQGLTKMEATLLPLIVLGACTAAKFPAKAARLAFRISSQQISFCAANMAAIQKTILLGGH